MKKFATVLALSTALSAPAFATDLNSLVQSGTVPYTWTGLYVGIHGGYADGEWDGTLIYDKGKGPHQQAPTPLWGDDGDRSNSGEGWLFGGQIGYNRQHGQFVYGFEVDGAWTDFDGSDTFRTFKPNGDPGDVTWSIEQRLEWYGTARARLGVAFGRLLVYGTGGIAVGETKADLVVRHKDVITAKGGSDETHLGWAAGAGFEWLLKNNITLGFEWLHVDLGEEDYRLTGTNYNTNPPSAHTTDSFPSDLEFDVFKAKLNYKLN